MTVKDIFDLRRQGRIEEAYEAIRPLYREHKGKFTTLCMFWTASDVFKHRLEQGRVEEAEKIYYAMQRMQPSVEDDERHSAAQFMHYAEGRLIKASEKFRRRYFAIKAASKRMQTQPNGLSETLITTNEPLINEKLTVNSRELTLENEAVQPEANVCDICVTSELSAVQQTVLDAIKSYPGRNVPTLSDETDIPAKSIERHVKVLTERGLIEHRGSKKTGGYHPL